jgi:hypothetical protein
MALKHKGHKYIGSLPSYQYWGDSGKKHICYSYALDSSFSFWLWLWIRFWFWIRFSLWFWLLTATNLFHPFKQCNNYNRISTGDGLRRFSGL